LVAEEPGSAKVINIMDALKKSVKQGKGAPGKAPAKSSGKSQDGKRAAASRSGSAKKQSRTAPKRKSA
jgi:DNA end-binding protein Ku